MLLSIGGDISEAVRQLGIAQGLQRYRLVAIWEEVVGEHLARQSEPSGVRGEQLLINTTSSMWSQELLFRQPEIMRRVREILGHDQVKQLRCRIGKISKRPWLAQSNRPNMDWDSIELNPASLERVERIVEPILEPQLRASARKAILQWERRRIWAFQQGMRPCMLCGSMQESRFCFACEKEQSREREAEIMRQLGRQPWMTLRELQGAVGDLTQAQYFKSRQRLRSIFERNYWLARESLLAGTPFPGGLRQLMLDLCMLTTGIDFEHVQDRHVFRTFGRIWGKAFLINQVPDLSQLPRQRLKKKNLRAAASDGPIGNRPSLNP